MGATMSEREIREMIAANLEAVRERIVRAAQGAGRDPAEITLVAVSKTVEPARILAAYELGQRVFGENRVEEAEEKLPQLAQTIAGRGGPAPDWHLIGHLQSRKSARALELFDLIHSVDSVHLAQRLSRQAGELGRVAPVLLELNVSGEESKYGFPASAAGHEAALLQAVAEIAALPGVRVRGLMTVAPLGEDPEQARPYFQRLRAWRDRLAREFPGCGWDQLSMGMSDDFEVAIAEGATMVRLGRAIFGPRPA